MLFIVNNVEIITMPDFYCGKGAIFDKNALFPFKNSNYVEPITPTIEQVIISEKILDNYYYQYNIILNKRFNIDTTSINPKYQNPLKVKKKFYKYYRQYAGYIDTNKDTIIYIRLMNFSNKKQANKRFADWENFIDSGYGDWYEKNQSRFYINLSKKIIND